MEVDYGISNALLPDTANYLESIPAPLLDRMEMIEINGYTQEEKLAIARQYLVPRQIERNGLTKKQITLKNAALKLIIDGYTRESGVRQLERTIGSVARGVAKKVAMGESAGENLAAGDIESYLKARNSF